MWMNVIVGAMLSHHGCRERHNGDRRRDRRIRPVLNAQMG
jgi:hypothetical protein